MSSRGRDILQSVWICRREAARLPNNSACSLRFVHNHADVYPRALYYRRPPPRSMKFYSFDRLHLDFDQRPEQGSEYAFGHDFTRVQKAPASGLNPRMLRQVNLPLPHDPANHFLQFNRASAVQAALSRQSNSRAPRLDMQDLRHVIFPLTEVIRHGATHLLHVCAIPVTFDGPQGMLLKDVSAIGKLRSFLYYIARLNSLCSATNGHTGRTISISVRSAVVRDRIQWPTTGLIHFAIHIVRHFRCSLPMY